VEWMGEYVNQNIAEKVFRQCDAIVVPSIWGENSPLVIHEAQDCKVPVITADFGGMAEYVQHQVNGLLFQHRDVDALTTQLQWALDHPQAMQALGNRGYLYSDDGRIPEIHAHCDQLIQMYQHIISTHGKSILAAHA
jgi:glycosyltransferase involved in cell wall biosynthesis